VLEKTHSPAASNATQDLDLGIPWSRMRIGQPNLGAGVTERVRYSECALGGTAKDSLVMVSPLKACRGVWLVEKGMCLCVRCCGILYD
jgi:hypothetical protein